jgi:fermentation-respiration switch protein FrsA (DUF1100 family)
MNSIDTITQTLSPLLIIHGNKDIIIPLSHGKELFNKASQEKKYFIELDETGHNDIFSSQEKYLKKVFNDFLTYKTLERHYTLYSRNDGDLTKSLKTVQTDIALNQEQSLQEFSFTQT